MPSRGKKKDPTVPLYMARWKLARLWLLFSGLIALVLIIQSTLGKYPGKAENVWSWALPTILPTLSVILTVLGANALEPDDKSVTVRQTFYSLAFWLSLAYLTLVLLTITLDPITPYESVELMTLSNLWLGPFQGIVASAIAVLFFTKKKASNSMTSAPQER